MPTGDVPHEEHHPARLKAGNHVHKAALRGAGLSVKQKLEDTPAGGSWRTALTKSKVWTWVRAVLFVLAVVLFIGFINNLPSGAFEQTLQSMFQ